MKYLYHFAQFFFLHFPSQFMVVTRGGPAGLGVPNHVDRELSVAFVHAPIRDQHIKDETAEDWGNRKKCEYVTLLGVQILVAACLIAERLSV